MQDSFLVASRERRFDRSKTQTGPTPRSAAARSQANRPPNERNHGQRSGQQSPSRAAQATETASSLSIRHALYCVTLGETPISGVELEVKHGTFSGNRNEGRSFFSVGGFHLLRAGRFARERYDLWENLHGQRQHFSRLECGLDAEYVSDRRAIEKGSRQDFCWHCLRAVKAKPVPTRHLSLRPHH